MKPILAPHSSNRGQRARGERLPASRLASLPGLLAASFAAVLTLTGCSTSSAAKPTGLERFEFTEPQMGLPFRIVLYAPSQRQADAAARAAFDRISALNAILSDYEYDSELSRLSRTAGSGEAVPLSADLWKVLDRAQETARHSEGAFDVTVGPLVSLWRKARRDQALPEPARLQSALQTTGWQYLKLDPARRTAQLERPRMRLDLGGIAKGYALDQAMEVLRACGVPRALVSGGGDMAIGAPPPEKRGWRIEVAPLDLKTNGPPAPHLLLSHAGLATSGDAFQYVEVEGVRYSHIVDPRTGLGLTNRSLVTVVAKDVLTADSLSTALSVAGPDRAEALTRPYRAAYQFTRAAESGLDIFQNRAFRRWVEK